jgi:hypothetical protein
MGRLGVLFVITACGASCSNERTASRAQCERLRDRYLDLELSSEPDARAMTPEARAAWRGRLAVEALSGPFAAKMDQRCEAQVSEAAYKCAVAASTLATWRRCLE